MTVVDPELRTLRNLNTPEDYARRSLTRMAGESTAVPDEPTDGAVPACRHRESRAGRGSRANAPSSSATPARSRCCPSAWRLRPPPSRRTQSARRSESSPWSSATARSADSGRDDTAPRTIRTIDDPRAIEPGGHCRRRDREVERATTPQFPVRAAPPVGWRQRDRWSGSRRAVWSGSACRRWQRSRRSATRALRLTRPASPTRPAPAASARYRSTTPPGTSGWTWRPSTSDRPSSCRSRSTSAIRSSGRSTCSACRGTGCRRSVPMLRRCGVATCAAACHSPAYDCRIRGSAIRVESVTPAPMVRPSPLRISASSRDAAQADERRRRLLPPLHVRQQIGAAGEQHGCSQDLRRATPRHLRWCAARDSESRAGAS